MVRSLRRELPRSALLLDAERLRDERRSDAHRLIGPALALANLLLLAAVERSLEEDPPILATVLFAELCALFALGTSYGLSSALPMLNRSALFPLRSAERFSYLYAGMVRSLPVLLWSAGTLIAFVVLSVRTPSSIPLVLLIAGALILTGLCWTSLAILFFRRGLPLPACALVLLLLALLGALGSEGIRASWRGDLILSAGTASLLLVVLALSLWLAWRRA
jgi:hypothetical protein